MTATGARPPTRPGPGRLVAAVLVTAFAVGATTAWPAQEPAADLPDVGQILARYVEALGGEEAIRSQPQVTWEGRFEMPGAGVEGPLVAYSAAPDLFYVRIEAEGVGTMEQGFDGAVAWTDNAMTGPLVLDGSERDAAVLEADYWADLRFRENYPVLELVGRESFADEDAYKVRAVTAEGRETFYYFSVASGLIIGAEGNQPTPLGDVWVRTRVAGYRDFGGRLYATEQRQSVLGSEQVLRLERADFAPIDPQRFALPPAIRTLVEAAAPEDDPPR